MATMKALRQLEYGAPLQMQDLPIPEAGPGVAVVKILGANIVNYTKAIMNGSRKYTYPTPLTPGSMAIGRVHAVGPDATMLREGQLALIDITIRSRDNPRESALLAVHDGFTPGSKKLFAYWRNGSFAEYMAVPLESTYAMNGDILLGKLGYTLEDLLYIPKALIPYGGLMDIRLRPGETVVISPATGGFGSAAVHLALALGARVIATGRNMKSLATLEENFRDRYPSGRLHTVAMTGSVEEHLEGLLQAAAGQPIDVLFDISPPVAGQSPHLKAGILALRHGGRVSLMGGQREDVPLPMSKIMHFNLELRGKWMYERSDVWELLKLVEAGIFPLGETKAGILPARPFQLEDWETAFDDAEGGDVLNVGSAFIL